MLLAIDTATATCSVALFDGELVAERTWRSGRGHTRELLPALEALLRACDVGLGEVRAIAVAIGPGTFNGLRVGVTTAKALAFATNIPLVGVGTLEVAAEPYRGRRAPVRALLDGGRSEVATALYASGEQWGCVEEPRIATLGELLDADAPGTLYCGEIAAGCAEEIARREGAILAPAAARVRRAGWLAEIGRRRLEAREVADAATLQPLYIRRPSITAPRRDRMPGDGGVF